MKSTYTIALVGRPNVGKSALFNRITGGRLSIVEDIEGVTRDRLYKTVTVFGKTAQFIDTGGIARNNAIAFCEEIRIQSLLAITEADAIVLVVDGTTGITLADEEIARSLLKEKKPVYIAVNKVDAEGRAGIEAPFYSLGFEHVFPISAIHGRGVAELLEKILPSEEDEKIIEEEDPLPKVAIIGRPNVGKSTLINYLLNENRCVVSDIPGTTRDAIDVEIGSCIFIDTAGIRKKKSEVDVIEKFAAIRSEEAIERADICLLIVDIHQGLTAHEKNILTMIEDKGKGCIIFLNKWDTVDTLRMEHAELALRESHSFVAHLPIIIGSAKTGRNIDQIFPHIYEVQENLAKRISTGQLNAFVEKAVQMNHPPAIQGKRLRIYYLTQVDVNPPSFVLFINDTKLFVESYRRYLINQFRITYHFMGCPIRFRLKGRKKKKGEKKDD